MIISEQWLREWVTVDLSVQDIADCLTNAGLEVDGVSALPGKIENLVIGEVLEINKHPDADRLQLTKVDIGSQVLDIVCGARNVAKNMKVAVATVGATLPNGLKIKKAKVRGVESHGMLCSASELGLEETSEGILALAADAEIGRRVDDTLMLEDNLIDIDLTPNRGDCLSVSGIARELKFLADGELHAPEQVAIKHTVEDQISITLENSEACPRYCARIIKGVDANAKSPLWLTERLRRSGIKAINPAVDVTNYVMLEIGQPMHAFDHKKINDGIVVRTSKSGEKIKLLDGSEATLDEETLLITDQSGPLAIAGVMGGDGSAIDDSTNDIVLEAAHFTRKSAAGCARKYGLHTESSHRFERGVDPELPIPSIERATELLIRICGGEAGPICHQSSERDLVTKPPVEIRLARLEQLLGMTLQRAEVSQILKRIADEIQDTTTGWQVTPPSYRFDIECEADLVEEVARVKGYNNIPTAIPRIAPRSITATEKRVDKRLVRQTLVARDYQEAITYSFIDRSLFEMFSDERPVELENPLAENMSLMRSSLLPGLISAAQFNVNRQRQRVRLFEMGASYHLDEQNNGSGFVEKQRLSGLVTGPVRDLQWSGENELEADFYDVKADIEAILGLTGYRGQFIFKTVKTGFTHPGQSAQIRFGSEGTELGLIARLHPTLEKKFGFSTKVFVFELDLEAGFAREVTAYQGISKYPSVRRDISVVVDAGVAVGELVKLARESLGKRLVNAAVFDVYQGQGVDECSKSVSLSMTLQDQTNTLTDAQADKAVADVLQALSISYNAKLRT